jgi:hypothetical protein
MDALGGRADLCIQFRRDQHMQSMAHKSMLAARKPEAYAMLTSHESLLAVASAQGVS